jgi:hypothetical protein
MTHQYRTITRNGAQRAAHTDIGRRFGFSCRATYIFPRSHELEPTSSSYHVWQAISAWLYWEPCIYRSGRWRLHLNFVDNLFVLFDNLINCYKHKGFVIMNNSTHNSTGAIHSLWLHLTVGDVYGIYLPSHCALCALPPSSPAALAPALVDTRPLRPTWGTVRRPRWPISIRT